MQRLLFGWSLVFAASSCAVEVPEGRFSCAANRDCPGGQVCSENICRKDPALGKGGPSGGGDLDGGADADAARQDLEDGGPPDMGVVEPPCSDVVLEPGAEQDAIFVSLAGSAAANCGDPRVPCLTIELGITKAVQARRSKVIIAAGEYPETVTLSAGLTLQGGWSHVGERFARQCGENRAASVVIASPSEKGVVARFDGTAALDTLTVRTKAPAPGESRYALFVTGANTELLLNDVHAEASAGGDGAAGMTGAVGEPGTDTCPAATGAAGAEGVAGAGAAAGVFGADGYTVESGQPGVAGSVGFAGMAGDEDCEACVAEMAACSASCRPTVASEQKSCGKPGGTGCGGSAGTGGLGGQSGGSSVALFVVDSKVTVNGGVLRAANGGAGGAGGDGGKGGQGASGKVGDPGTSCRLCRRPQIIDIPERPAFEAGDVFIPPIIFLCFPTIEAKPGVLGGKGGDGGGGGRGGDGAAGSSFAVYTLGSGAVTYTDTKLLHGEPGAVAGSGAAGQAGPIHTPGP